MADQDVITDYLTSIYGQEPDGLIWIGGKADGFRGRTFDDIGQAAAYAAELDAREERLPATTEKDSSRGVYHRGTTLARTPDRRGTVADSAVVRFLALDADIAGAGHKASNYPAGTEEIARMIAESGFPEPTAWIASGGGLYPQWRLVQSVDVRDEDARKRVMADFVRFEQHFQRIWERHGFKLDSVRDLARIWRIPGTVNRKVPGAHIEAEKLDIGSGELFEYDALISLLPEEPPKPAPIPFDTPAELPAASDGVWTKKEAETELKRLLKQIRNGREGAGFNNTLNACSLRIFRFAPEFWKAEDARVWIEDAVRAAFDGNLSGDDIATIESAAKAVFSQARTDLSPFSRAEGDRGTVKKVKKLNGSLKTEQFTDAAFAPIAADEVMRRRFVFTKGLGWLRYTGIVWEVCEEESGPREALRQWVVRRYAESAKANREDTTHWLAMQSASKLSAITGLCKGIAGVAFDAGRFDQDPDVLNTPSGLLHLDTLKLVPHDPAHLCTKVTTVDYEPGADSEDFKKALEAIPDGVETWMQLRLGQAATGHTPDDDKMVMLSGAGRNGKTVLMSLAFKALGSYAEAIPSELLLTKKNSGGASPEKMMLRGVRLAYVEETPEGRHLDTTTLKQIVGTPYMEARDLYKSITRWATSHALFLNTNFLPNVAETDDGTWGRLMNVHFPYRYRFEGDGLGDWNAETDRNGDPTIKYRLLSSQEGQRAMLAWLVEGARRWYAAGRTLRKEPAPSAVTAATREWRKKSDLVMGFFEDRLKFDSQAWIAQADLHEAFRTWLRERGYADMSARTFFDKIASNSLLNQRARSQRVTIDRPGRSRAGGITEPFPTGPKQPMSIIGIAFADTPS